MREALKARGSRPSLVPAARPWRESWLPAAVFTAAVYFLGLAGLILVIQDHGEWAVRLALAGVIVAGLRLRFRGPSVSDQAFVEEFGALADLLKKNKT